MELPSRALDDDRLLSRYPARYGGAALVDGDSRFAVLRKIAIPLAAPGLAATFILVFISSWNEFLLALILTGSRAQTLPIAVAGQITQYDIKWGNMMAAGVITTVPVLVFALLTQRLSDAGSGGGRGHWMIGNFGGSRARLKDVQPRSPSSMLASASATSRPSTI